MMPTAGRTAASWTVFVALAAAAFFALRPVPSARPTTQASVRALVGRMAPDFTLPDLNNFPVSLSESRGRVVVLELWATWCPPCVEELPIVTRVAASYADRGVVFHAVEVDDNTTVIKSFLKRHGLKAPVLLAQGTDVAERYAAQYIPLLVVIDRDGMITFCDNLSPADVEKTLSAEIEKALKAGQAA